MATRENIALMNAGNRCRQKIIGVMFLYKFKCHECGCTVHGKYFNIHNSMWCVDCAEEWLEDELAERKRDNRSNYLERLAEILDCQILEV